MSKSMPCEIISAIFFGARFTTKRACLPSISRGLARSRFIPASIVRLWSPKLTSSATNFSELGTSVTLRIVPTRTSIWLRRSGEIGGLTCVGFIAQF